MPLQIFDSVRFNPQTIPTVNQASARANIGLVDITGLVISVSKGATATDERAGLSKYDHSAPFATLSAAKTAAESGDLIVVGPGIWDENDLLKNGVHWRFLPGADIVFTGNGTLGIFDDGGGAVSCTIVSEGDMSFSPSEAIQKGVVYLGNENSIVHFKARRCFNTNAVAGVFFQENGTLFVECEYSESTAGYNIWWINGEGYYRIRKVVAAANGCVVSQCVTTPTGKLWVECDTLISTVMFGAGAIFAGDTASDATVWIHAKEIIHLSDFGSAKAVSCAPNHAGKIYVHTEKISSLNPGQPILELFGGQYWITTQKLSSSGGAFVVSQTNGGMTWLEVLHFESLSSVQTGISVSEGTVELTSSGRITAVTGLNISGGVVHLRGVTLDARESASGNPIVKGGGTLILGAGTVLVAEATTDSIQASDAQTVKAYGAYSNKAVNALNITLAPPGFTVDADVA